LIITIATILEYIYIRYLYLKIGISNNKIDTIKMAEIDLSKWKNIGGYLLRAGGFLLIIVGVIMLIMNSYSSKSDQKIIPITKDSVSIQRTSANITDTTKQKPASANSASISTITSSSSHPQNLDQVIAHQDSSEGKQVAIFFFIIMLGMCFAFPSLLEGPNNDLSTMRITVFMMVNVICMLILKNGWDSGSMKNIGIDEYWMGIIAFVFGAKATQSFFENKRK